MARLRNKKTHCLNCDYEFRESENYCPNCSQENHDLKIPFKHFVEEILEGIFHFDSKVWLSIKTLFFYPGKITKDFLAGKRVSFVPPIRLYVFFSFVFFFCLNLTLDKKNEDKNITELLKFEAQDDSLNIEIDSFKKAIETDTLSITKEQKEGRDKIKQIINLKGKDVNIINQTIYKYMSFALFLLLPIFALIMKLVYYRSHKFYYEHFIAAIHYHVMIFIILLISLAIYKLDLPVFLNIGVFIAAFIYFIYSLKVVYEKSWANSILKAILIFILYGFILLIVAVSITAYVSYSYLK